MRQPFTTAASVWRSRGVWRRCRPWLGAVSGSQAPHNFVTNSAMVGAGVGTLPTGWISPTSIDGLTRTITAVGTDATTGWPYIEARWAGTSGATATQVVMTFDAVTATPAVVGQTFTPSVYLAVVGGSIANFGILSIRHRYYNAAQSAVTARDTSMLASVSSELTRFVGTPFTATDATTASTAHMLAINFPDSAAVDVTFRIVAPQMNRGSGATEVVMTSGTAVRPFTLE